MRMYSRSIIYVAYIVIFFFIVEVISLELDLCSFKSVREFVKVKFFYIY